jgi:hypothetical protein
MLRNILSPYYSVLEANPDHTDGKKRQMSLCNTERKEKVESWPARISEFPLVLGVTGIIRFKGKISA